MRLKMKDIIIVMEFTIKDMVKRKSFIISTFIILMLIVIGFNVPNIIKNIKGENTEDKLLIIDNENVFEGNLELLKQMNLEYEIEIGNATFDEIKEKIENEDIYGAIIIEKQENNVKVRYIIKNTTMISEVPENIVNAINSLYTNIQISKLGLTNEQIKSITPAFEFDIEQTQEEKASGNIFAMMLMSIVLFYALLCLSSVKFNNNRKNIKDNGNISNIYKSKNYCAWKNNRYWNCWISTNGINCGNSFNKCKNIFRARIIRISIGYVKYNSIFRNYNYYIFYIGIFCLCFVICSNRFDCKQTRRYTISKYPSSNFGSNWILFIIFYNDESDK